MSFPGLISVILLRADQTDLYLVEMIHFSKTFRADPNLQQFPSGLQRIGVSSHYMNGTGKAERMYGGGSALRVSARTKHIGERQRKLGGVPRTSNIDGSVRRRTLPFCFWRANQGS